jgi:hypothetical protein
MKTFREYCEERQNEAWNPEGATFGFEKDLKRLANKHGYDIHFEDPSSYAAPGPDAAIWGRAISGNIYSQGTPTKSSEEFIPIVKALMKKWDMVPVDKNVSYEEDPMLGARHSHAEFKKWWDQFSGWDLPDEKWIEVSPKAGLGLTFDFNHESGNYERQRYGQDPRRPSPSYERGDPSYESPSSARPGWSSLRQSKEDRKGKTRERFFGKSAGTETGLRPYTPRY